jgi:hypothetical protein
VRASQRAATKFANPKAKRGSNQRAARPRWSVGGLDQLLERCGERPLNVTRNGHETTADCKQPIAQNATGDFEIGRPEMKDER